MYRYSKIKKTIYRVEINSKAYQCIICFRSEPTWRIDRLDFGSIAIETPIKDIHPVMIDYESRMEGVDFRRIYDTIAEICFHRIQNVDKIIYLRADSSQKLLMLRWFVNKHLRRFSFVANVYAVVNGEQIIYSRDIDPDPSVYLIVPK